MCQAWKPARSAASAIFSLCSKISPAGRSDHSIQSNIPNSSGLSANASSLTLHHPSVCPYVLFADELAPDLAVPLEDRCEFLGRGRCGDRAQLFEPPVDLGSLQRLDHLGIHPPDDGRRSPSRSEQAGEEQRLDVGKP